MSKKKKKAAKKNTNKSETVMSKTDESAAPTDMSRSFLDNGIFSRFETLRQEMDSVFNQFTDRFGLLNTPIEIVSNTPRWDVTESDKEYEISVELPGVAQADIEITVAENMLRIRGEKQQSSQSDDTTNHRVTERSYGVYERAMTLPFNCAPEAITAEYNDGVLNITIEKPETDSQVKKIEIKKAA